MSKTLYMTPAELKIHEQTLADEKAGVDPYGDANESVLDAETLAELAANEKALTEPPAPPEVPEAPVVEAPVVEPPVVAEAPAAATVVEAPTIAPGKDGSPVDLSDLEHLRLAPLPVVDEASYIEKRDGLQSQIDALDAQWEEGTITPEQRRAQIKPLRDQLESAQRQIAADVGEYNATGRMNQQATQVVIERIKAAGLRDGLDYAEPAKAAQYDMATRAIATDPKNANLSWVRISAMADTAVRAMNGIAVKTAPATAPVAATPPAAPVKPAPAPSREPAEKPPVTLRDLPVASRASEQGDTVSAKIAAGDANQKDAIWKNMTKAQRAHALDE